MDFQEWLSIYHKLTRPINDHFSSNSMNKLALCKQNDAFKNEVVHLLGNTEVIEFYNKDALEYGRMHELDRNNNADIELR